MSGRTKFIALELGVGRNLTALKLEAAWESLHKQVEQSKIAENYKTKITFNEPAVPKHH